MVPEIETAQIEEIKLLQERKLAALISYLADKSPFYQKLFKTNNIDITGIRKIEDLAKIPTSDKDDLQQQNEDFFCVPRTEIIDYVTTSGTLGDPVTIGLTDTDLERLAYNEAISFACAGVQKDDILQLTTTIDRRFMAGLAYFLGARKLGAGIIRVGAGIPELQWDTILKFKPTYLIIVPSFLLKLIEYAKAHNIDYKKSGIKAAICIGEALRDQDFELNVLGNRIKSEWDIALYSTYASTEMSTAFTECSEQQGGHLHPELLIAEILDDEGNEVPDGYPGELTITTLGIEAMPLLRFRTGDVVVAHRLPCKCGRNTLRLGPVLGRKKQMIKYKGTTLYPPAMDNLLNDFSEVTNHVIEIYHNEIGTDEIKIKINASSASERLLRNIKDHFRSRLRVSPKIEITDLREIQKLQASKLGRKPIRVIDTRTV
ncbi:phenylacetate--CoA ligase family protein [Maribacter sp. MJ134]|uniref:phenylacetate--CoA ligase family protein n=1 Tax=Maribacter sp. MJ134 TaxID=2496865 RepID=UPI000F833C7F|nr:AMP-binding protein [Maribacter sp. MJ134]AZQ59450.1 phenylacetate--CoA ligase family protein [Maribacter sp. MJ134]